MFIFLAIIIIVFVYKINKHKIKGAIGEQRVASKLRKLPKNKYKVFNNIFITTERGSSQIDHIVISIYGIFVLETKYYKGWIHGNEKSQSWTQTIYTKKTKFRNPIKQNWSHIFALKEALSDYKHVKYHNFVVFTGRCKLKNITSQTPVIYRRHLMRSIQAHSESANLDIDQVNSISAKLEEVIVRNKSSKKEHVRQIKNNTKEFNRKKRMLICPRCDGDLEVRKGQYGKFYGCSNYPKCRFSMPYKN
jgi:hypothetical protein